MTRDELKQAAIDCLGQAFKAANADTVPLAHVVQAAVTILLTPEPTK